MERAFNWKILAVAVMVFGLSGCIVAPGPYVATPYYGGYGPGYDYGPTVVIGGGGGGWDRGDGGWGHDGGGGGGRGHGGGGGRW